MLTEVIELRIGEVVMFGNIPVSLSGTKRNVAFLVAGKPAIDREAVRKAAERHRRRFDKTAGGGEYESNSASG